MGLEALAYTNFRYVLIEMYKGTVHSSINKNVIIYTSSMLHLDAGLSCQIKEMFLPQGSSGK